MGTDVRTTKEQLDAFQFLNKQVQNLRNLLTSAQWLNVDYERQIEINKLGAGQTTDSFVELRFMEDAGNNLALAQQALVQAIIEQATVLRDTYCGYFPYSFTPADLGIESIKVTGSGPDYTLLDAETGGSSRVLQYICKAGDKLTFSGGSHLPDGEYSVVSVAPTGIVVSVITSEGIDTSVKISLSEVS